MVPIDFISIFDELKTEVISVATSTVKEYKKAAKADAVMLIEKMKDDLERWAQQFAEGKLSAKDVEFLILGQKELIEMEALKQVGLSLIKIDELKGKILNSIINKIIGFI